MTAFRGIATDASQCARTTPTEECRKMKNRSDSNLNQEARAHRHKMAARLAAMDTQGKPKTSYAARLRGHVLATVARHFGGSAR